MVRNMIFTMLFPILFPIITGLILLVIKEPKNRNILTGITGAALVITGISVVYALFHVKGQAVILFELTSTLPIYLKPDSIGLLFAAVVTIVWILAGFFSFSYLEPHKGTAPAKIKELGEKRFYGFYLMVFGILIGLDFSGNLITFYMCYELMTLLSMPLVIHTRSREAVMAALKYLFYSFCGAYMVLFGLYFLYRYGNTLTFTAGGVLDMNMVSGKEGLLFIIAFLMIIGFGVKAGMFPLHAWLPAAHPVAPAPASAALSAVIVKGGVLGMIRVVYYMFGAEFIRGTWVQTTWLTLTLITVFMGSMLAFREKVLKKRLAYSTVSQVSYILFGLALLQPAAMEGALLHVVFHAFIKCTLFLTAGAIIHKTGKLRVEELTGIGKEMPVTMWCYTIVSLALIGIPPTSGFISKWYLATGALDSGIKIFSWLGPVVLLISALLTAGYLLPLTMKGFFPGEDYEYPVRKENKGKLLKSPKEASFLMLVPIVILTVLAVALGMFPNPLAAYITDIVSELL